MLTTSVHITTINEIGFNNVHTRSNQHTTILSTLTTTRSVANYRDHARAFTILARADRPDHARVVTNVRSGSSEHFWRHVHHRSKRGREEHVVVHHARHQQELLRVDAVLIQQRINRGVIPRVEQQRTQVNLMECADLGI